MAEKLSSLVTKKTSDFEQKEREARRIKERQQLERDEAQGAEKLRQDKIAKEMEAERTKGMEDILSSKPKEPTTEEAIKGKGVTATQPKSTATASGEEAVERTSKMFGPSGPVEKMTLKQLRQRARGAKRPVRQLMKTATKENMPLIQDLAGKAAEAKQDVRDMRSAKRQARRTMRGKGGVPSPFDAAKAAMAASKTESETPDAPAVEAETEESSSWRGGGGYSYEQTSADTVDVYKNNKKIATSRRGDDIYDIIQQERASLGQGGPGGGGTGVGTGGDAGGDTGVEEAAGVEETEEVEDTGPTDEEIRAEANITQEQLDSFREEIEGAGLAGNQLSLSGYVMARLGGESMEAALNRLPELAKTPPSSTFQGVISRLADPDLTPEGRLALIQELENIPTRKPGVGIEGSGRTKLGTGQPLLLEDRAKAGTQLSLFEDATKHEAVARRYQQLANMDAIKGAELEELRKLTPITQRTAQILTELDKPALAGIGTPEGKLYLAYALADELGDASPAQMSKILGDDEAIEAMLKAIHQGELGPQLKRLGGVLARPLAGVAGVPKMVGEFLKEGTGAAMREAGRTALKGAAETGEELSQAALRKTMKRAGQKVVAANAARGAAILAIPDPSDILLLHGYATYKELERLSGVRNSAIARVPEFGKMGQETYGGGIPSLAEASKQGLPHPYFTRDSRTGLTHATADLMFLQGALRQYDKEGQLGLVSAMVSDGHITEDFAVDLLGFAENGVPVLDQGEIVYKNFKPRSTEPNPKDRSTWQKFKSGVSSMFGGDGGSDADRGEGLYR